MEEYKIPCSECKEFKMLHSPEILLCEDCYEGLFKDDHDFVLENETATIKAVNDSKLVYTSDATMVFTVPKRYILDSERKYDLEVEKLLRFLFDNMYTYDNAKGFDKVKHMFKEVE